MTELKDQIETVHQYSYDKLGRQTEDKVSTLGTGVDGAVRRIERTYTVRGGLEKVSSYDAATAGNVVNEVLREYNDLEMLTKEYQEHEGAKDGSTLYVEYNYDETVVDNEYTKGLRLKSVRYPDARLVHYTYGSGDGDKLNRLDAIKDDSSGSPGITLAEYTYLGLGTIVIEDFQEPDVKLDLFGGTSGTYAGFDRFDRVVDQRWIDYEPDPDVDRDRYKYGYDRASNRLWRENTTTTGKDEFYTYDGMYQLESAQRGDLTGGPPPTGVTNKHFAQQWKTDQGPGLDPTGNWTDFWQDDNGDGTWNLKQQREHNEVNETTEITATSGPAWADPVHDRAGNMTTVPRPSNPSNYYTCKYDAWHRLVETVWGILADGEYEYDGLNRRTIESPKLLMRLHRHFFWNASWQNLEVRTTYTADAQPESLSVLHQYVWSARYIDAPVLRDKPGSGERLYYLNDANFNVTTLVDTSGDALEHYQYDPYGKVTVLNGGAPDSDGDEWTADPNNFSDVANEYFYTGRKRDLKTLFYYYRNRYYHAELGRFFSRDPIGYGGSARNLYQYVTSRPLSAVDPLGMADPALLANKAIFLKSPQVTAKQGLTFKIGWFLDGRVNSVFFQAAHIWKRGYDGAGNQIGIRDQYTYDISKPVVIQVTDKETGKVVQEYTYMHDEHAGNLQRDVQNFELSGKKCCLIVERQNRGWMFVDSVSYYLPKQDRWVVWTPTVGGGQVKSIVTVEVSGLEPVEQVFGRLKDAKFFQPGGTTYAAGMIKVWARYDFTKNTADYKIEATVSAGNVDVSKLNVEKKGVPF